MGTTDSTLALVGAYHERWTNGDFEGAADLLASDLQVEVPINDYPTKASFTEALVGFSAEVSRTEVLSRMASGNEAMLLYDMDVRNVGVIRIVEHFTVVDGKISRLRQIHDTAPIRAAGASRDASTAPTRLADEEGYALKVPIRAPRSKVYQALTTLEGLAGWWTPLATGQATAGREFVLHFQDLDEEIVMQVEGATAPSFLSWTCVRHTGHPEWEDSRVIFELDEDAPGSTALLLRHVGLTPDLGCYSTCVRGWDHFLASLASYAETGRGSPFGSPHQARG